MFAVRRSLLVGLMCATAACGSVGSTDYDAGSADAIDSGPPPTDSAAPMPDAAVIPRRETSEIAAGAGRVSGSVYTVDLQIGHGHIEGP